MTIASKIIILLSVVSSLSSHVYAAPSAIEKRATNFGWQPLGCTLFDGPPRPQNNSAYFTSDSMTVALCEQQAVVANMAMAGLRNGRECLLTPYVVVAERVSINTCAAVPCAGQSYLILLSEQISNCNTSFQQVGQAPAVVSTPWRCMRIWALMLGPTPAALTETFSLFPTSPIITPFSTPERCAWVPAILQDILLPG